jgi:hypothetical protein
MRQLLHMVICLDPRSSLVRMIGSDSCKICPSPHLPRVDSDIFTTLPHSAPLGIPIQRLSHIISITTIIIVVDNPSVYRITHFLVEFDGGSVFDSYEQVYEPCIFAVADCFEG